MAKPRNKETKVSDVRSVSFKGITFREHWNNLRHLLAQDSYSGEAWMHAFLEAGCMIMSQLAALSIGLVWGQVGGSHLTWEGGGEAAVCLSALSWFASLLLIVKGLWRLGAKVSG